jgi:hypothetical protein
MAFPTYTDEALAKQLRERAAAGHLYVLGIANKFHVRLLTSHNGVTWEDVGLGDLAEATTACLKPVAAAKRLFWHVTTKADLGQIDPAEATVEKRMLTQLKRWQDERDKVTGTGGRGTEASPKTRFEVASLAAWRCQFDGCTENLRSHFVPGAKGNYGYFAHIVASSSDGPRGDATLSPRLADDPNNIMLLCDKCHRLIDRIAPGHYDAETLREMRARNVADVERLLDMRAYPPAKIVVIGGNIEGQPFGFDERLAEEALWLRKLSAADSRPEWFMRNGGHLGKANSPGYWLSLFELLRQDLPRLKGLLTGSAHGGQPRPPLAVFPVHGTSALILTGRLLGDGGTTHLFQFHRDNVSGKPGGQWAWPDVEPPAADKYKVRVLKATPEASEDALLQINLTAGVPGSDLSADFFTAGDYILPTVEVTVDAPSHRTISHPEDLVLFGQAVDRALQILQDEWYVKRTHLVAIAPATACMRLGQKLQARHHADVQIYERQPSASPGVKGTFEKTIQISSTEVTLLSTGEAVSIS